MKRKICVILTTRGNYAKMYSTMKSIQEDPELELQLVLGGEIVLPKHGYKFMDIIEDEFTVSRIIHFLVEGENLVTMAKSAGLAVTEFSTVFEHLNPDAVVVIADRFECLSISLAASYMNVPLAHIEGGEISGSIDESIRHAITKLSHLHFPATQKAADYVERMGESKNAIFPVGCTSLDIIKNHDLDNIQLLYELQDTSGIGAKINFKKPYVVVLQHPVTTEYEKNLEHVNETIKAIQSLQYQTVWIWPNIDAGADGISKGIRQFKEKVDPDYVRFFKSLPIQYYSILIYNSKCIVGNSSSGIRESSFLGIPCVNIGTRQTGREKGKNVIDVQYEHNEIANAIKYQVDISKYEPCYIYGDGNSGIKIANILKDYDFNIQKLLNY